MGHPWAADVTITPQHAGECIVAQFPALAPVTIEPFSEGWDNVAFLVNGTFVFRFPRRASTAPLLAREVALLPLIAPCVPLAIPAPQCVGAPTRTSPWPFAGYRRIEGHTACRAHLTDAQRANLARPLAQFLRALHAIDATPLVARGLPFDEIGRLDHAKRLPLTSERARSLQDGGLIASADAIVAELERNAPDTGSSRLTLVHGDLYSRHLIVDDAGSLQGIIDWGDVHLGEPALDLAAGYLMLPPAAQTTFFDAYGAIDERTHRLARYRALYHATLTAHYAKDIDDADLLAESLTSLRRVLS